MNRIKLIALLVLMTITSAAGATTTKDTLTENALTEMVMAGTDSVTERPLTAESIMEHPVIDKSSGPSGSQITGVITVTISLLAVIAIVWITCSFRAKIAESKMKVVEKAIENRCELPAEFYSPRSPRSPKRLQTGICWIGVGLATIIFFFLHDAEVAAMGLIPLFIGIAQVTVYLVLNNQKERRHINYDDNED